jgi:simple sugar transport system substrate-binding protein
MVEDLKTDKFGTHGYSIKLADDSVQLLHTKYISDDVWTALTAVRKQIVDGSLKIEPVWDAPKVRALMTSIADAPKK